MMARCLLPRKWYLGSALIAGLVLLTAMPVSAQGRGGGLGKPPKKDDSSKGEGPADDRPTGSQSGRITKYETPKDGDDEDIQAYVTLMPTEGSKAVKVRIERENPPKIELGEKKEFDPEEFPDILTKGLYCTFSWKVEEKKGVQKKSKKQTLDLTGVTFDRLDVSGKIDEIKADMLIIRCKPKNDQPWPDAKKINDKPARGGLAAPKPKPIPFKKLKLRIIEDVTRFLDADNQELDPSDFDNNQTVDATVVYGRGGGIVLSLKSPTLQSDDEDDRQADRDDGPRPPPPS